MNRTKKIVGIGEILWDMFPSGPQFGGAPANFCCAVAELASGQVDAVMVSAVGDDVLGRQAVAALENHRVVIDHIATNSQPTGQVFVSIDSLGHASYEFAVDSAWDYVEWTPRLQALASQSDAICFGTLGQRGSVSRSTIREFIKQVPGECLRVLDINLRSPYWNEEVVLQSIGLCNALKLNEQELPVLCKMLELDVGERTTMEYERLLRQILDRYSLRFVALTLGADGSILLTDNGEVSRLTAIPTTVFDTVGAGDSFTAALIVGVLLGMDFARLHRWAGEVASFVCTQRGATPTFPDTLRIQPPL